MLEEIRPRLAGVVVATRRRTARRDGDSDAQGMYRASTPAEPAPGGCHHRETAQVVAESVVALV
jgi:hypothetical protein